ncbi:hypothetical protein DRQ18_03730, partial [bacterium]
KVKHRDDNRCYTQYYRLVVRFEPFEREVYESNDDMASAAPTRMGEDIYGSLFPVGDVDWYKFYVKKKGRFYVKVTDLPSGAYWDALLYLYKGGEILKYSQSKSGTVAIESDLPDTGEYSIALAFRYNKCKPDYYKLISTFAPYPSHRDGSVFDTLISLPGLYPETTITVNVPGIEKKGKYLLKGEIITDIGQIATRDDTVFYVVEGDLAIKMRVDKEAYRPLERINITGEIINLGDSDLIEIPFSLYKETEVIYSDTLNLMPGDTYRFSSTTVNENSFFLHAVAGEDTLSEWVKVLIPEIITSIEGPEVVGVDSFPVTLTLYNPDPVHGVVNVKFGKIDASLLLMPERDTTFTQYFITSKDTVIEAILEEDVQDTLRKCVTFGEKIIANFDILPAYPPGVIEIPYTIENIGSIGSNFRINIQCEDSSVSFETFLPPEGLYENTLLLEINEEKVCTLSYEIESTVREFLFDAGEREVVVAGFDKVGIENIVLLSDTSTMKGETPFGIVVRNEGANPVRSEITLKGYLEGMPEFVGVSICSLRAGERDTVEMLIKENLPEGRYMVIAEARINGNLVDTDTAGVLLREKWYIKDAPQEISVVAGEESKVVVRLINKGFAYGEGPVRFTLGSIYDITHWVSGKVREIKEDTFSILTAWDIASDDYYGMIKTEFDERDITVHVKGYEIAVRDSLDRPAYSKGDTATFFVRVENLNELTSHLFARVTFMDYDTTEWFDIGGCAKGIYIDSIKDALVLMDTAGVYVAPSHKCDRGTLSVSIDAYIPPDAEVDLYLRTSSDEIKWGDWERIENGDSIVVDEEYVQYKVSLKRKGAHPEVYSVKIGDWISDKYEDFTKYRKTLKFRIPVAEGNRKIFYGIYLNTGRALYLGEKWLRSLNDTITVYTEKDLYNAGDTVLVYAIASIGGELAWKVSGEMSPLPAGTTRIEEGVNKFTFPTSLLAVSSEYSLDYTFVTDSLDTVKGKTYFHLIGYSLRVIECRLDRSRYRPGDRLTVLYKVESNRSFNTYLTGWVRDREWNYAPSFIADVPVDSGLNVFYVSGDMPLDVPGPAFLTYGFYLPAGNEYLLLACGTEGFDIVVPDTLPPCFTLFYPDPSSFNPLLGEVTSIRFALSERVSQVEIEVDTVKRFVVHDLSEGDVVWDGTDERGEIVFPGVYTIKGIAIDTAGNISEPVFATIEVITDTLPPSSRLVVGSPSWERYISMETPIEIVSEDDITGVDTIYFRLDSIWRVYTSPFYPVKEGTLEVEFYAVDKAGNREDVHADTLLVDDTHPESKVVLYGPEYESLYVTSSTWITVLADDPVSSGVSSGVWKIYYQDGEVEDDSVSFTLTGPDGVYEILYHSVDRVENEEPLRKDTLILDNTPPYVSVNVGEPVYAGDYLYVTFLTPFTLNASDALSGVNKVFYAVDDTGWAEYLASFVIEGEDGLHTLFYYAVDNLGNKSDVEDTVIFLDYTPPSTQVSVGEPQYEGDRLYITSHTPISLEVYDSGSGVAHAYYRVDEGEWVEYGGSMVLTLPEGEHVLAWRSVDNLGNEESVDSMRLAVDNTPPLAHLYLTEPQWDSLYVSSLTEIFIKAEDPEVLGVASGVWKVYYRIDGGLWKETQADITSFHLEGPDGIHTVDYYAQDHVLNASSIFTDTLVLDNTPPLTSLEIGSPQYLSSYLYVNSLTPFTLTAVDNLSGVLETHYAVDDTLSFSVYSS